MKTLRFAMFLLVSSGFFFLYSQVYNVLPLYLKRVVEPSPAMDVYTMANPFVIVFFPLMLAIDMLTEAALSFLSIGVQEPNASWGTIILDGTIHSLRRFKEDVKAVKAGYECGIALENFQDLKEGDILETYQKVSVAREE